MGKKKEVFLDDSGLTKRGFKSFLMNFSLKAQGHVQFLHVLILIIY